MNKNMDIILQYEGLVYSIIKRNNSYNDIDDLYQVGMMGLINAYKNFKTNYNVKFSTYAYIYIDGEIKKYIRENKGIKINPEILKLNANINKANDILTQKLMHKPTLSELANFIGIEIKELEKIININQYTKSLDYLLEDDICLYDFLKKDEKQYNEEILDLKNELQILNEKEKLLIKERYFNDRTQSELSEKLGISQVQISREEKRILSKLKTKLI
ncbi:MAG: sigma-70 family RNA polymerase sigma factor [Tenericutes bacterium]|jgi:RNA polymerase sporulation-specific sigma factor|nr:sigma-70 family RNA polymerase sigma factor [Mycoplasmatota bacterium]